LPRDLPNDETPAQSFHFLRAPLNRDGIAIEKCPDALDEVQYATERELAIRSLDRGSRYADEEKLHREVLEQEPA